jgi:hypothetical protein
MLCRFHPCFAVPCCAVLCCAVLCCGLAGVAIACDGTVPFRSGERIGFNYLVSQVCGVGGCTLHIQMHGCLWVLSLCEVCCHDHEVYEE